MIETSSSPRVQGSQNISQTSQRDRVLAAVLCEGSRKSTYRKGGKSEVEEGGG